MSPEVPAHRNVSFLLMLGFCGIVITAGPLIDARHAGGAREAPLPDPPLLSGCAPNAALSVPAWPDIRSADTRVQAVYRCGEAVVSVDIARFLEQWPGKEAVSATNRVVDRRLVSAARPTITRVADKFSVRAYHLDRGADAGLVWSWYAIGRRPAAGSLHAKLLEVGHAAIFSQPKTAILTVTAWGAPRGAPTERVLEDAARDVWAWYLQL
jgi:hypothetical protein